MLRTLPLAALLALGAGPLAGQEKKAEPKKGTVVELDGLKSETPPDWRPSKPANRLRSHQFTLPRWRDDTADAELAVYPDWKGSVDANVKRWKESFVPPPGKSIDEVSKLDTLTVGKAKAAYFDVHGTYHHKDAPFDPNSKSEVRPGWRMIAVVLETKDNTYLIRVSGPQKTVEHHKKGFDGWLKGLK